MHSAFSAPVWGAVFAAFFLSGPVAAQDGNPVRMDLWKTRPAGSYLQTEPLPAPNRTVARSAPDFRITEDADPELSPFIIACDAAAADPADATRPDGVDGVAVAAIDLDTALSACTKARTAYPVHGRAAYNLGRAEMARGEITAAVADFEAAAASGHPLAALTLGQIYEGAVLPDVGPADAVPFYTIAAETGLVEAQMALGRLLTDPEAGLEPDYATGVRWFRAAAAQGVSDAAFELGWAFENGRGVPRDGITAARWYRRAADAGNTKAANNLGWLYANGTGVPRDEARAVGLYRLAAENGVSAGMANLGWMLENGIGTDQNVPEAAEWYMRAAELGETEAMLNLGWLYLTGHDVAADAGAALGWFERAYQAGRIEALSYIGELYETDPGLRDPAQAARYYVRALAAGDSWPADRPATAWDGEMTRAMQAALSEAGVFAGPFDAVFGASTQEAMDALLARAGRNG